MMSIKESNESKTWKQRKDPELLLYSIKGYDSRPWADGKPFCKVLYFFKASAYKMISVDEIVKIMQAVKHGYKGNELTG